VADEGREGQAELEELEGLWPREGAVPFGGDLDFGF
jgi:hypothetical protein